MLTHKQMVAKVTKMMARRRKRCRTRNISFSQRLFHSGEVEALEWVLKEVLKP